jgi:hypothetical protein
MTILPANSFRLIACVAMIAPVGCVRPWSTPFAKPNAKSVAPATLPVTPAMTPAAGPADPNPSEMAGVMEKLAQVRELDPAAEQQLVEELRRTPPSSWSLVAEQFRASLAMHQQLASRPPKAKQSHDPMAEFRRAPPTDATPAATTTSSDKASSALLANSDRPSGAIGSLVDPRSTSEDSTAELTRSGPYSMPALKENAVATASPDSKPPAEFVANGQVNPITGAQTNAVQPATFEEPAKQIPAAAKADKSPVVKGDEGWQALVKQAADDLSHQVSPSPTTTAEVHQHVSLRLMRLLTGDTERALEPIPHIPPAEQDYWSRQVFALATYLDHHSQPDDKRRAAASVVHLDDAVSNLRELGSLSLHNLSFCKNVYGYGAFEPYEKDCFSPGQQVSLYVEVENYHSTSSEKGYCTLLGATYELLDDKGKRISGGDFPDVDDCCRSRRRDFHIQFGLNLPNNLSPGQYRAEVVVKDRQSDKLGHSSVPFEIQSNIKPLR